MLQLVNEKLLIGEGGQGAKLGLAAQEGVKLKRLTQAVRALWRSSSGAHDPHVSELKTILRPSPQRNAAAAPSSVPGQVCSCNLLGLDLFEFYMGGK